MGYAGLVVTFPFVWAVLTILFSPHAAWAWTCLLLQPCAALLPGRRENVLRDAQLLRDFWLIPLRDALALAIWVASFAGHKILWRGIKFELKDGKLRPA